MLGQITAVVGIQKIVSWQREERIDVSCTMYANQSQDNKRSSKFVKYIRRKLR